MLARERRADKIATIDASPLSAADKDIARLHWVDDMDAAEIAAELGLANAGVAGVKLKRIAKVLAKGC